MWADNNIVKTLSKFHSLEILSGGEGVARRRGVDGTREQERTEVSCPAQQKDYSETFHLIYKGNGKESRYDMGGQTKGHNWAPKLSMRFWNSLPFIKGWTRTSVLLHFISQLDADGAPIR